MSCPAPRFDSERIGLKHGGGGPAMRALIERVFLPGFEQGDAVAGVGLSALDDGAALPVGDRFLIFTTDSHVVKPTHFAGGDIGRLAIAGTVNDLAMMGTTEILGLSCAVILEEGFPLAQLEAIWLSLRETCDEADARILTGDTKVMGHGELDGIVINTTGVGWAPRVIRDSGILPGDDLVITGTLGDHGLAVMVARHQLALEGELRSDVAPIADLIAQVLSVGGTAIHAMKDPTRGGLVSALKEMASKSRVGVVLDEAALPVQPAVRAASELLGIDPLYVANEGKAVIAVAPSATHSVLQVLRAHPRGRQACVMGRAIAERPGSVILDTGFGKRLLHEMDGEPLPRIC